jgi:Cu2+-exporting ATPase
MEHNSRHHALQQGSRHANHGRHAGHSVAMFREKFWLCLALTVPVVFWSREVQHWLGYKAPAFPGAQFIPAILGTAVLVYGGSVFIRGARGELSGHRPGMMTLISLAILVAFAASLAATLGFFEVDVWWELATLITIMVLGHWLEMKAISQASGALDALAALLPDSAEIMTEQGVEKIPVAQLRVGDVVLVRPGARVPADGIVTEGTADVDESMITGESRGVSKEQGDGCRRRDSRGGRKSQSSHICGWRADSSFGNHANDCSRAGFWISRAGFGRSCSRHSVLCRPGRRCVDIGLLVVNR